MRHLPLRKALEQYAGARNRTALVKLLSPVQQAAESCDWVKELVDSGVAARELARGGGAKSRPAIRGDDRWKPHVPVAVRRARARREMNKVRKKGKDIQPVEIEGRAIARSFWGKRWYEHLESFSDYANRLPRGRTCASRALLRGRQA